MVLDRQVRYIVKDLLTGQSKTNISEELNQLTNRVAISIVDWSVNTGILKRGSSFEKSSP